MKKRIFFDMDGVLAKFQFGTPYEKIYEKGYYRDLPVQSSLITALNLLGKVFDVYVLSSYLTDSKYALDEKKAWLAEHVPGIDEEHQLFSPCGKPKFKAIPGGMNIETDILIDDYKVNCDDWEGMGGTFVKVSKDYDDAIEESERYDFTVSPDMCPGEIAFVIHQAARDLDGGIVAIGEDGFIVNRENPVLYTHDSQGGIPLVEIASKPIDEMPGEENAIIAGQYINAFVSGATVDGETYIYWRKKDA